MNFWNASGILCARFNELFIGRYFSMSTKSESAGASFGGFGAAVVYRNGFIDRHVLWDTLR
jgi:hypothetical protein